MESMAESEFDFHDDELDMDELPMESRISQVMLERRTYVVIMVVLLLLCLLPVTMDDQIYSGHD